MTKIGIASDHAGYEMKEFLVGYLSAMGYDVHDFGPGSPESVDYADYAHPLAEAVEKGEFECGHRPLRFGRRDDHDPQQTSGHPAPDWRGNRRSHRLIRRHNNANIIVFPARFITNDEAVAMLDAYFAAQFEGGRHQHRIEKMAVPCGVAAEK